MLFPALRRMSFALTVLPLTVMSSLAMTAYPVQKTASIRYASNSIMNFSL